MRYLLAVCFLAIVAFADASPAAAQQACVCFCRVQGEGGGGCWVDVPGCNPRSGVRSCNDGAMCGYSCGTPGQPARRSAPDRKSTRLNSSHLGISYAVFCF